MVVIRYCEILGCSQNLHCVLGKKLGDPTLVRFSRDEFDHEDHRRLRLVQYVESELAERMPSSGPRRIQ